MYAAPHRPPAKSLPPADISTLRAVPKPELGFPRIGPKTQRVVVKAAAIGALAAVALAVLGASAFLYLVQPF